MNKLENLIPPPLLLVIVGAAMYMGSLMSTKVAIDNTLRWLMCAAILFIAALFGPIAIRAFGKANTTIDPVNIERAATLVTWGVYRHTRNPMYVSLTLILCAWCVWLGSPVLILGPLFFVLYINRFQIVPEERFLLQRFGDIYGQYRQNVRRWI